ncbi:MAG: hypothetical protein GY842_17705, partial [bacterium]|nr:hypothetical protein [bacterium]
AFYNGVLRADYAGDDAGTYEVAPVAGSIFDGLGAFQFDAPGMYDADYPDQLLPLNGSTDALVYSGGLEGTAAVQYAAADSCERLVYFGFPFETIRPAQRPAVMARVLDFLSWCLFPPADTEITSPAGGSAHNSVPPFAGTAVTELPAALDWVDVQIERDADGWYWTGSGWATGEVWLAATGTSSWGYALPALNDGGYHLRARAWTTKGSVDSSPAELAFTYDTLPPASTVLVTPTGSVVIPTPVSVTLAWEPVEPDGGSTLAYEVQLDGQSYTTTQTAYTFTHLSGGLHTWGVQVFDAAGNRSAWVTDTFSVRLYNCWLPVVMRNFGASSISVLVNGDFETDEGWVLNQLAVYVDVVSGTLHVHSGSRSVRVGIPPGEPGSDIYSSVAQTFVMPSGDTAALRLWVYPIGEGDDPDDWHYVSLRDELGATRSLDHWQSDARAWELREYDLSDQIAQLAGQTVTLYIGTRNDGDDDTA